MIKATQVKDVKTNPNPHNVDARMIYDTEHATPVDVAFYVLEGNGVVEIGGERMDALPDTLIESPAKVPHRWLNESESTLRFLVIKVPRQKEPTRIL